MLYFDEQKSFLTIRKKIQKSFITKMKTSTKGIRILRERVNHQYIRGNFPSLLCIIVK